MLKSLVNKIKTWWAVKQLYKEIQKEELGFIWELGPTIQREAHETYKLGHMTVTLMSSKEELDRRLALLKAHKDTKEAYRKESLIQLAYDHAGKDEV